MKKSIFLFFAALLFSASAWADWCGNSFITVNGLWCTGSNSYVHDGGKFHGKDLGTLTTLELGGEFQVWPSSTTAGTLCYKIDDGTENSISLPKTGTEGNNSKHSGSGAVDLSGLAGGSHSIAVWFKHGSDIDNNGGSNYVATFTIAAAGEEPEPEPVADVTLYFVNHPEWTNLKAHVWDNNDTPYKDWNNSESMTNTGEDKDGYAVYSYTFPSKYTNIIFKGDGQQTQDNVAAYDVAKPYFCDNKWYASLAEIPALGAVVTYDYYVIGTVNSWALKDASYGMTDDNADGVYEKVVTLADGKNQMKINNGTWDKQAGYDQLDAKYEGVSRGTSEDDNNIIINIATGKDITVKFDKNANKITLDGLTKIEDYYTVVGVAELFGTAWDRANETNKMAKQGDGSYKLVKENVTLAAIGYDWKIAKNGEWWDDAATGVNPAAGKNNTLTITTAGRYNVTFTLAANLESATVETELLEAAVVIPDCFISGNATLTGGEGWQGNEFTMVYDEETETWTYTLAGLQPEKEYELKVVCGGTWYNYADLASIPTGVTEGNDHSIAFKMAAAGDVVVTYNVEAGITLSGNFAEPVTYVTVVDATVSTGTWSIDLAGTWEERTVTIQLWQDNVQGFGEYAANAETGYTCQLGNPYAELTPTTVGLYADNGDGTFTFTATMTDTDGGIYNISVSGDNPVVEPETKELEGFTAFAKEEGSLSVYYAAEDWSQFLELYIENYTGYGEYEVSDVYYGDVTGDYGMSGSVTIGYDEDAETDVLTATLTTSDGSLIVLVTLYDKAATMPLMITNLRTEQVGASLQLTGRNDMDDADVMLFLNDYTGEDKAYEVDTENSLMTYGGIELTVLDGSLTKSVHPEYGDMFIGVVNVYAEEEDMNLALELTMYAAPATNVVVVNAVATYDDNTGALTLTGIWEDAEVSVEIAGYDGKESVEYSGPQGIKFETPDVVAFGNEAEITVAGEDITVVCTASSWTGDVFNVTITTLSKVGTALENVAVEGKAAKAIVNGQLIIIKNGVQYNAQGAVVK